MRQTASFNWLSHPFVQEYKYDALYRITEATETSNNVANWIQIWDYDLYGNRTSFTQNIGGNPASVNPAIVAATNRFDESGTNFDYDLNGNLIRDGEGRRFTFNGDNKQIVVKDANNNPIGQYFYDGEGKRVKKISNSETTIFVYSSGKLVAEYSSHLSTTPSVSYTTTDHLGTPRIITDAYGQVKSRRDFLPFGEDLLAGVGSRTTANRYGATSDDVRQKFTGYQKDTETSLDFAEARMYDNRFGRFTAVDPLLASGKSANPQTFNRFVYVGNNPIVFTDPDGKDWYYTVQTHFRRDGSTFETQDIYWSDTDLFNAKRYTGPLVFRAGHGKHASKWVALDPYEGRGDSFKTRLQAVEQYEKYLKERNVNAIRGFADAMADLVNTNSLTDLLYNWGADAIIGRPDPNSNVYTVTNRTTNAILIVEGAVTGMAPVNALRSVAKVRHVSGSIGFKSFDSFKSMFGKAGTGKAWHHIVEQNPSNIAQFGNEAVHNTQNLIKLESGKGSLHSRVSGYYSSKQSFTDGKTVRQWLSGKSFQEQYDFGIEVLKRFGWKQ